MKKITILFLLAFSVSIYAQSWTSQFTGGGTVNFNGAFAVSPNVCWMCGAGNVIYKTTNGGTNWTDAHGNITGSDLYDLCAIDANYAWCGAGDGGIWRTTNGGVNWTYLKPTQSTFIDYVHMFDVNIGWALSDPPGNSGSKWGFYTTTNGGTNWVLSPNAPVKGSLLEAGWNNGAWSVDTGHIWWTSNNKRIYKGSLWGPITFSAVPGDSSQFGVAFQDVNTGVAICTDLTNPLANQRSTNGGATWSATGFTPTGVAFGISNAPTVGHYMYWISDLGSIYRSTDDGVTFTSQFTLPYGQGGYCISMANVQVGWCGTGSSNGAGQIFKYTSSDPIGITQNGNDVPQNYSLSQNYPNPFNPTSTINYALPYSSDVTIKVYNMLGSEVMTVVNGYKTAGSYSVSVNASNLSSGVYFYTLRAGDFKESKKMIVAK